MAVREKALSEKQGKNKEMKTELKNCVEEICGVLGGL